MKKIILLCGLLLIVSCADVNNSNAVSDENQAKFEQHIESFRTFAKGFNAEDMEMTLSVVSEDVQWSPPYYNGGQLLGMMNLNQQSRVILIILMNLNLWRVKARI